MKTPPSNPEFDRFTAAMRQILSVSKTELQRRIEADSRKTGKRKVKQVSASRVPAASPKRAN